MLTHQALQTCWSPVASFAASFTHVVRNYTAELAPISTKRGHVEMQASARFEFPAKFDVSI